MKNITQTFITFILLVLVFKTSFGQSQKLILTKEQNDIWIDSLKSLNLENKLEGLKDRLLLDTNVFVKKSYPDRIIISETAGETKGERFLGKGKPFLFIDGLFFRMENTTKSKNILQLTKLLNTNYVKEISLLNDPKTTAIYGFSAQYGVIVVVLKKKRYLKYFKKLEWN